MNLASPARTRPGGGHAPGGRCFEIRIAPTADRSDYGFTVTETFADFSEPVVSVARAGPFRPLLLDAVRHSGYLPHQMNARRRAAFWVAQVPGVRLVLAVKAAQPVRKPQRRRAIIDAVSAMSSEEALYWYSRADERGLRALRILLTDD